MDMGGDTCDTGLALGLNYNGSGQWTDGHGHRETIIKLERSSSNMVSVEPSLTLGLSEDTHGSIIKSKEEEARVVARQLSPHSAVSSFSDGHPSNTKHKENSSIKSEEAEKVSFRVSDEELEEGSARKKLRLTKDQSALLEDKFKEQSTLNPKQKQALAKQLNLRPRQVEVWFQNRRARTKLKQTEIDCEVLKRYCETLSDENRRLQKEVHELRALRFASPVYMQFPAAATAAALTMCPSCKKITTGSEGSKAGPFATAPKAHGLFMNPFTHSAAC